MADWYNVQPDEYKYLGCNYTAGRPWGIKGVTIHHMAGDLDADGCNRVWRSSGAASAHYSVDRNGYVVQHVDDTDRAWACGDGIGTGGGNDTTISIEHANNARGPWTVYPAAIESGAHLVAALCRYYGLGRPQWMANVFPHKHWSATACPGELAGSQNAEYMARAQAWYDAMQAGADAPTAPSAPSGGSTGGAPSAPASGDLGVIPVHYGLRVLNGAWWPEVTNFNNANDDGYAGAPFTEHDLVYARADRGTLRYRAKTREDGWLPYVTKGDPNDTVNGCAGYPGHAITGVEFYYTTPEGEEYRQAWYRSQTTMREGWLPVCCDDGTTYDGYDGWAGMDDELLDRLQLCIAKRNPF